MAFQPINKFLFQAADSIALHPQAKAGLVCSRIKKLFSQKYPELAPYWKVRKYEDRVVWVQVTESAFKAELYMRKDEIMNEVKNLGLGLPVADIRIE